jgi:glucose/arabinose dehydrogenase
VLTVQQPFPNHNGGNVMFGPDQLLYIGFGDGGSGGDPLRTGLDPSTRLGKILRIDPTPEGAEPFTVPPDNPFVGAAGTDPTIWATCLRNPWRFSFDPASGDLWIADVGQNELEEINHAPAAGGVDAGRGLNFGWSAFEADVRFNEDQSGYGHTPPVYTDPHADGNCSVSGGMVYRGALVADLAGWYVFGDYCSGTIWGLDSTFPDGQVRVIELTSLGGLSAVSTDADGELIAVSNAGSISRIITG